MASNPDLVIRGGNIADGLGGELFEADVAISDGRITEVGKVSGKGKEEIDARGKLVAPGFVDVHTHYDGQVTWSQDITPSSQNGVTTAIMGNCGVGFAPCRPSRPSAADPTDGRRRGYSGAGAERRHSRGPGKAFRTTWTGCRKRAFRHRYRRAIAARRAARLCDGRARRAPRSRPPPRTTARWRHWRAMPYAPARWAFRPRAPSTTAPRPATTRRP